MKQAVRYIDSLSGLQSLSQPAAFSMRDKEGCNEARKIVEATFCSQTDRLVAWLPQESAGASERRVIEARQLSDALADRAVVHLDNHPFPTFEAILAQQVKDLGYGHSLVQSNIFWGGAGGGAPSHFDWQIIFSINVSGRKVWRLKANEQLHSWPKYGWMNTSQRSNLSAYCRTWPISPPTWDEMTHEITLLAWDTIYVPPGWWHMTKSTETTAAITVTIVPDLLTMESRNTDHFNTRST